MRPTEVLRRLSLAIFAAAALATGTGAAAQEENVLHSFQYNGKDAAYPRAGVIFDKAGSLYGTTSLGGDKNYGRVFELSPKAGGGWTETMLHLFNHNGTDGTTPLGGVIVDSAGNLYGTTVYGGTGICFSDGCGTVFELSPTADGRWNEKILYDFINNGTDGLNPYFGLTFDSAGNLYGTTYSGGANGEGTVFELTPAADGTWTETVLHSFGSGIDTGFPESLISDHGNIFGTTADGGTGSGNVFELTPTSGGG